MVQRLDEVQGQGAHQRLVGTQSEEKEHDSAACQRENVRGRAQREDGGKAAFFDGRFFHGFIVTQKAKTCNGDERKSPPSSP